MKKYSLYLFLFILSFIFLINPLNVYALQETVYYDTDGIPIYNWNDFIVPIDQQVGSHYTTSSWASGNSDPYTVASNATDNSTVRFLPFGITQLFSGSYVYSVISTNNSSTPPSRFVYMPYALDFCTDISYNDYNISVTNGSIDAIQSISNSDNLLANGYSTDVQSGYAFFSTKLFANTRYRLDLTINISNTSNESAIAYRKSGGSVYEILHFDDNWSGSIDIIPESDGTYLFFLRYGAISDVSYQLYSRNTYNYCYKAIGTIKIQSTCWPDESTTGFSCDNANYFTSAYSVADNSSKFIFNNNSRYSTRLSYQKLMIITNDVYANYVNNCVNCIYRNYIINYGDNQLINDDINKYFTNFNSFITGDSPISQIVTAPITFINSISTTCTPVTLTVYNKPINLPCGTTLFWNRVDVQSFKSIWNILFGGFIIFTLSRKLFKLIVKVLDPNTGGVSDD